MPRLIIATAGFAGLAVIVGKANFDHTVLSSGVFRYGTVQAAGSRPILFYRDGRTATVSVRKNPASGALTLSTNGKPDASLGPEWMSQAVVDPGPFTFDAPTQVLLPLIPLAHAAAARTAVVIGQGSGMTTHALLASPNLTRLVTIEIEPEMIKASRLFMPANRRAFEDPRSQYVIDDARAFFAADRDKFDLIIAEPSNPWVSGVSGLFTTEFYARVKQHLAPDGVFAQWLQLYEIDDELALSVLAAIDDQFPAWTIFAVSDRDVVIVATPAATLREPDWSVLRFPGVVSDLRRIWPVTSHTMDELRIADRSSLEPLLARPATANSDYYPTLDLNADRTRFMRTSASGLAGLTASGVDFPAIHSGRRTGIGDSYAIIQGYERLREMAVNAAMRTGDKRGGIEASEAAERVRAFHAACAATADPTDWRVWTHSFAYVADLLHGGMSGVADTAFFALVQSYVDHHHAPAEARAAVAFVRGMAAWNFHEAATAADPLVRAAAHDDLWLDADFLRDGAVVAMLRDGDPQTAWDAYQVLTPRSARSAADFRSQLLRAYLRQVATQAQGAPTRPR